MGACPCLPKDYFQYSEYCTLRYLKQHVRPWLHSIEHLCEHIVRPVAISCSLSWSLPCHIPISLSLVFPPLPPSLPPTYPFSFPLFLSFPPLLFYHLTLPLFLPLHLSSFSLSLPPSSLSHSQARFYTYIWSLYDCLVAAALCPTVRKFLVLDRPNPAGGVSVDGSIMREQFASFVGRKVRLAVWRSMW